jgi:hypothetical protein
MNAQKFSTLPIDREPSTPLFAFPSKSRLFFGDYSRTPVSARSRP